MGIKLSVLSICHAYNGSDSNYFLLFNNIEIDEMHFEKVFEISQYIGLIRGFPLSMNLKCNCQYFVGFVIYIAICIGWSRDLDLKWLWSYNT